MKKIIFAAMFFMYSTSTIFTTTISDIPPNHWAYKSVKKLIERGYLALYDDKTFRGDSSVSRIIFASVIGKLLDEIESGTIKVASGDLKEIKKLSAEFKNELSDYEVKWASLEKRIEEQEASKIIIQKDLAKITYELRKQDEKILGTISDYQSKTNEEIALLKEELKKSEKRRKKMQKWLTLGIIAAGVFGASK